VTEHDVVNRAQRNGGLKCTPHSNVALPGLSISCFRAAVYFCYQFHEQSSIPHVCACACVCSAKSVNCTVDKTVACTRAPQEATNYGAISAAAAHCMTKGDTKYCLTLQRGVTSTARHSVNISCRGVTGTARIQ